MTLEQFNKLIKKTKESLERKLESGRKTGKLYPSVTKVVEEKFQLVDGASTEETLSLMKAVVELAEHTGGTITHQTFETSSGRVGYYSHTNYYVKYKVLVDEVTDSMVKKDTKKALLNIMGLSPWGYLDCKVFQLFREGKISWEDVVKSHKEDCTL